MSGTFADYFKDDLEAIKSRPVAKAPATLGEIFNAEWKLSGLDTLVGSGAPLRESYNDLYDNVQKVTGKKIHEVLGRPRYEQWEDENGRPISRDDDTVNEIKAVLPTLPEDQQKALAPFMEVRKRAREKATKIERDALEVSGRAYGLSGYATGFLSNVSRQVVDPGNLAASVVTGGASRGAPLLQFIGREFLANAGAQALVEPAIEANRGALGLDAGFGRAVSNTIEAGAAGAGLSTLFRLMGQGLARMYGERPNVQSESSAAPASPPQVDVRADDVRAASGDVAPSRDVARTPFLDTLSPEMRGVIENLTPPDLDAAARVLERNEVIDALAPVATGEARHLHSMGVDRAVDALERGLSIPEPSSAIHSLMPHRVAVADGSSIEVRPRVVEASSLLASSDAGYLADLQPRDRTRAASEQQIREMASRLDPERLGFSTEADRGAPIIGNDLMVESGNGRIMALRQAYAQGAESASRYRDWLTSQGVDVTGMREPVLVRERVTALDGAARQAFTVNANRATTLTLSASERALADGKVVTGDGEGSGQISGRDPEAGRTRPDRTGASGDAGNGQPDGQANSVTAPKDPLAKHLKDPEAQARFFDAMRVLETADDVLYPNGADAPVSARAALQQLRDDATALDALKGCLGQGGGT